MVFVSRAELKQPANLFGGDQSASPVARSTAQKGKKKNLNILGRISTVLMATRIQNKNGRHSTDKKPPIKTSNIPKDPGDLEEEEDPSSSAEEEDEEDEDEDGGEDEQENDALDKEIPFSDIESNDGQGEDVDIIPYTKLHKDNHAALTQALSTFALPLSTLPFHIHQSVTASELVTIDVNDDLTRELAFYKQALEAAKEGRKRLLAEGVPFSRPADYFAEMVKDDEHMERVLHL